MRMVRGFFRFIMKVCAFFFSIGLLGLAIGVANELFNLGIFNDDYPVIDFSASGNESSTVAGTFGEYAKQTGLMVLAAGFLGAILLYYVGEEEYEGDDDYSYREEAPPRISVSDAASAAGDERREVAESDVECPHCGQLFVSKAGRQRHMNQFH